MEPKMSEVTPPPGAVTPPKSGAPKVLGMLNIIFGALLIICSLCSGVYLIAMRAMTPVLAQAQKQVQEQVKADQEAQRAEQLKQLDEQEQAATTEEEKQSIQNQRQAIQSAPVVVMPMPDMSNMYGMNEPLVFGYFLTDMLTALVTNVFLIIAGVGLVGMKDWGRRMALWVAGIKIARLFVSQVVNVVAITPVMVKQSVEMLEQMMSQVPPGPGGAPPAGFGTTMASAYGIMFTLTAVGTFVIGSIYPGILLWMLTRPEAKAACRQS
jgi:hypothetical protein